MFMVSQVITIRGIIFKNDKIFAQTLKKSDGVSDYWCTPGGHLELGESLLDGLSREIIEETGARPQIGKLLFIQQFKKSSEEEMLELFFHIINADEYETIDLAKTSHGQVEIAQCAFVDPKSVNLLPAFLQTIDIASYIKKDQPVYIDNELPD